MSGIPSGIGDGFVQHLEFCAFFNLLPYLPSHTLFEGGIVMTPIGVLWNKTTYDGVLAAVGQTVMDEAAAQWLTKAFQGTAVDTAAAYEYLSTHPTTIVSLNATQIVDNGWKAAVSSYVTDWENDCADSSLAADLYADAQDAIASWPSWVP